jgi:small GTP-binding protein
MMQAIEFKVSLIGETGSGKTAFIEKLKYGQPIMHNGGRKYTLGVDVSPYSYRYGNNTIRLNLWDCAGDERYRGLGKDYLVDSDLVMIFGNNNSEFENWVPENTRKIYINQNEELGVSLNKIRTALH